MIDRLGNLDLAVDPLHYDRCGGLRYLGTLCVQYLALYYSGALYLPFVYDLASTLGASKTELLLPYALVAVYVILGISAFCRSMSRIRQIATKVKAAEYKASVHKMRTLTEQNLSPGRVADLGEALKPYVYYLSYHVHIIDTREWPLEWSAAVQVLGSTLVPVAVVALDKLLT